MLETLSDAIVASGLVVQEALSLAVIVAPLDKALDVLNLHQPVLGFRDYDRLHLLDFAALIFYYASVSKGVMMLLYIDGVGDFGGLVHSLNVLGDWIQHYCSSLMESGIF